jgi:hypothetical protein
VLRDVKPRGATGGDDSRQASPMVRDLLAGVPDDCRLVEAVGAPDDPTGDDEARRSSVPSHYRICTVNAGDEFCAIIEIVDEKQR